MLNCCTLWQKGAGVDGILAFTRIDASNKAHTERFAIGDADQMTDAIIELDEGGIELRLGWHPARGAGMMADGSGGCSGH